VLRRIFVSMRDEVRGQGNKLYSEELSGLYISPNILFYSRVQPSGSNCVMYTIEERRDIGLRYGR